MFSFVERTSIELAAQVRCVWTLRSDDTAGITMPIVPDGSVEIVLNLGERVEEVRPDGSVATQPRMMMVGQPTGPVMVRPTGAMDMVGIRLQPWASRAFFEAPAVEAANQTIDASLLEHSFPGLLDALLAGDATNDAARLDVVEAWLRRQRAALVPRARFVPAAVRIIQSRSRLPSIRMLAAELGVTMRTMQRAFAEDVGMGPKTLQRITRLQRAIGSSRMDEALPWASIAARAGYFDEAHLNLDFRAFAGCSPSQFAPRAESLTELMLASRPR